MKPHRLGMTSLSALLWALVLVGCKPQEPAYTTRFTAFGTRIDLTVIGTDRDSFEQVSAAIQEDFASMQSAWHGWEPGPLGRVNRLLATGEEFSVPPSVYPLIRRGQVLAASSGDLFNPAIGRLIDAWGFNTTDPHNYRVPDPALIARLVAAAPKMSDLVLDGIRLRSQNPAVKLDFGAFGKGYGVDLVIEHLRELGVRNAIVNAGGDLRAIGSRDGHPWRVPIRRSSGAGVFATIRVQGDESVFTSGAYERNFVFEGETYHDIIDPRTGYPATGTRSVTVAHPDATTADAAANALFIAGPERWPEVARAMEIRYVLLIDSDGVLHMSPPMEQRIELMETNIEVRTATPSSHPDAAAPGATPKQATAGQKEG
jgi:thiamine biosynthesis lipoprotein